MKETLSVHEFPVWCLEVAREETDFATVDAICDYFRRCIESQRAAVFITVFDHLAHTRSLPEGHVGEEIRAAKNLVFCFGISLPKAELLACRPRSIGVAETNAGFLVTFLETPMPVANSLMEDWARGILRPASAAS
jgi:hypothetical protein